MTKAIGKVVATERHPSTIEEFHFWTQKDRMLRPFDVVKVSHLKSSSTFGVIEEISHMTDSPSPLAGFISSDFGDVSAHLGMERIGMNYVRARVVGNSAGIFTPVLEGSVVSFAGEKDIKEALGLSDIRNPLPCGYLEMYEEDTVTMPVHLNAHFLIGPEGAHLNISGISGLASKTSYAMFLLKAIQDRYATDASLFDDGAAFVFLNVKGRDLLAIDEFNEDRAELENEVFPIYEMLGLQKKPFQNVRYFYPFSKNIGASSFVRPEDFKRQKADGKAQLFKYNFKEDREKLELLFANIDDPNATMESIVAHISSGSSEFRDVETWPDFRKKLAEHKAAGASGKDKEISVLSWRKFSRHFNRVFEKSSIFNDVISEKAHETRLEDSIRNIKKGEVFVIDIAKMDEELQGFVFGDVISAIYDLQLGPTERRDSKEKPPSKVIIFIDELNRYASKDVPKNSPILRRVLEVTERGRSLGIVLFGAEQFRSDIHNRVKGNCSTNAFGRTNAIEVANSDYSFVPSVFKSMMTRLKQGEYILQNPVFRSLLNVKFPKPIYRQFK